MTTTLEATASFNIGSTLPSLSLGPESLRNDALVMPAVEAQWEQIAELTGQTAPTLTQWRAVRRIIGDREWPISDAVAQSPNPQDAMSPWDRIALTAKDVDLSEVTSEQWDGILASAGYTIGSEAEPGRRPPRLAIVITEPENDRVSYLVQTIMHGTAIGAEIKVYGPSAVREHPRTKKALERIGLDPKDIFVGCETLDAGFNEIEALLHSDRLADRSLTSMPYFNRLIRLVDEDLDLYRGKGIDEQNPRGLWKDLMARRQNLQKQRDRDMWQDRMNRHQHQLGINAARAAYETEVVNVVSGINEDPDIDGALVLLPVPDQIRLALGKEKDLDGVNPENHVASLTAKAAIETAEYQLGPLEDIPPGEIFLAGLGNVGKEIHRLLAERGIVIPEENILADAEAVHDYEARLGGRPFSAGFMVARASKVFDATKIKAGERGLLMIDAAGNVDPDTLDDLRQVTPMIGGLGLQTTKNLFDSLVERWMPKLRGTKFLRALGSLIQRGFATWRDTAPLMHPVSAADPQTHLQHR